MTNPNTPQSSQAENSAIRWRQFVDEQLHRPPSVAQPVVSPASTQQTTDKTAHRSWLMRDILLILAFAIGLFVLVGTATFLAFVIASATKP